MGSGPSGAAMIDRGVFIAGMATLAGSFGREMDEGLQRAYYAVLSPELSTAQFEGAVAETMKCERFWPSPAVLLQHAEASESAKMLALPSHCAACGAGLGYAPGSGKRFLQHRPECPSHHA